ncbi:thioredoxin-disulfide reductase [Candidatus Legionella polyplacis]|uniref:Thioredoxin reductase n=1 Tax=Candidatus Legionella polyplacis TaxID=2005262 RepID=A0ABZ2GZP4_9GAMM
MNSFVNKYSLVIIGSGPAGYTAAIYAARANLNPIVIAGDQPGGQLTTTTSVDNWPGNISKFHGPELMENIKRHVLQLNVNIVYDRVTNVNLKGRPFFLKGEKNVYFCDALIIATGSSHRFLGISSEKKYLGHGVSFCATCDGYFFRNKRVCVVGGGNTAVEEALYLSNIVDHVILIHRKNVLRAEFVLQNKLFKKVDDGKIEILWNHTVIDILGDGSTVNGITAYDLKNQNSKFLDVNGVFIAIGFTPNTNIFKDQLLIDKNGYIVVNFFKTNDINYCTNNSDVMATSTSVSGVFACGDVMDPIYRQAITASGFGSMAALDAERYFSLYFSKKR